MNIFNCVWKNKFKMKKKANHSSLTSDDEDLPLHNLKEEEEVPLHKLKKEELLPLVKLKREVYVPLHILKKEADDPNSYTSLCRKDEQFCEFCDKVSKNRYSSLIHNVSHIIIPLINQTVFQCETCLHHFTSEKDLQTHKQKKHDIISKRRQLVDNLYNTFDYKKELERMKREQPIEIIEIEDDEPIQSKSNEPLAIKNRLVFEDDNQLLNDLTTDCKVNIEVTLPSELFSVEDPFAGKSVHYDDLMRLGYYRCKKCCRGFPIRLEAIIHEASHINLENTRITKCCLCNEYIRGNTNNLRLHYLSRHKQNKSASNIQPIQTPSETFQTSLEKLIDDHREKSVEHREYRSQFELNASKTFLICDGCYNMCKNSKFTSYVVLRYFNDGKKHICAKCGEPFIDLRLVRREHKWQPHYPKKVKSNEERLESIRKRLKLMKN